ncbi:type II and III secretion system protein family protein [Phenylobacterium montanum]|uniref:Type II and III secretion system protein family protein n=1 Tax=Phenylobacterium montanum TaxID=2823693 RepID=A0A975FVQ4_9CAUL|nr:type II and III secretion system protein family protein [Caulobacter sp. S6]QUD86016.1 type II and III secretion system protein family protein [Caulobacter sp. S6]
MIHLFGRSAAIAAGCALLALAAPAARAATEGAIDSQESPRSVFVAKDKSAGFRLDYPVSQIVVAQPDMLQLVATTDRSFYIRGKAIGATNLLIYDRQHHLAQVIDVRIGHDVAALQADLNQALPGEHIEVASFADGVLLRGVASTMQVAERAGAIAERYAPKAVTNEVQVLAAKQIRVDVRVIEASRTSLKDMGFNISAQSPAHGINFSTGTGLVSGLNPAGALSIGTNVGSTQVDLTLQALEQKGVVRTLAKPNLVAMSGEEASFLAGGEFPYPVPQALNQVTIEFRQFGVKLNVTPYLQDNGQIKLKVAPEVSQLDQSHSIRIDNFTLPGLTVSRAATVVELRDGQSFAIAGLFQQGYSDAVSQVPGLADLPVLGTLFRSSNWQHQQTELVIIVTPHLIAPVDHLDDLPDPLKSADEPSAIDLILAGITEKPSKSHKTLPQIP